MPPELQQITDTALSLPTSMRASLVRSLLESLDTPDVSAIEKRWIEEADARCRQIEAGEVELLDGNAVLQELEASL